MTCQRTRQTYDALAARYAARPVYPLERELATFLAQVPSGGQILDLGCGPGQYARRMAAQGYCVLGLDLSWGMLVEAQRADSPPLLQGDICRLPVRDSTLDGCFASASLLHLPRARVPGVLEEVRRTLRAGGTLYLGLKLGTGEAWVKEAEGARFFVYHRPEELDALVEAAGFVSVAGWISPPGPEQQHAWINRVVQKPVVFDPESSIVGP